MSTTTQAAAIEPTTAAPTTWGLGARVAAAGTFLASGVFWAIGELVGFGQDSTAYIRSNPTLAGLGIAADMLAVPFLFGSLLVWLLLSWRASRKIASVGAGLLVLGLTGQAVLEGVEMVGYAVDRGGRIDHSAFDDAINSSVGVPGAVFMVMFFVGAFLGILVMMVAVWRSRALPRTAILLLLAFQLVQVVGVPFPVTVVALAGFATMAVSVLRGRRALAVTAKP